jgi:hypothetical protein
MGCHLAGFVDDEAGAAVVGEVVYTFCGNNLYEFDVSVLLSNGREVHIDQIAEFIAGLVEMENHKGFGISLSDFPEIFIS